MTMSYCRCSLNALSHIFSSTPPVRAPVTHPRSAAVALPLASPATWYSVTPATGTTLPAGATRPTPYPRPTGMGARLSGWVSPPPAPPEPMGPTGGATIRMRQGRKLSYKPNPPPGASPPAPGGHPGLFFETFGAASTQAFRRAVTIFRFWGHPDATQCTAQPDPTETDFARSFSQPASTRRSSKPMHNSVQPPEAPQKMPVTCCQIMKLREIGLAIQLCIHACGAGVHAGRPRLFHPPSTRGNWLRHFCKCRQTSNLLASLVNK